MTLLPSRSAGARRPSSFHVSSALGSNEPGRPRRRVIGAAAALLASTLAACGGADTIEATSEIVEEPVGQVQQAIEGVRRYGMIGIVSDLDSKAAAQKVISPDHNQLGDIVGIAREPGNGGMFCAWYADWEYSCGSSWDQLDDEVFNTPFVAGEGMEDTANIIGMAVGAGSGFVFTWTADGLVHGGPYDNPAAITIGSFLDADGLVDGKHSLVEIVGIAMDDSNRVYTYFSDMEYIEGTIVDLDATTIGTLTYGTQAGHRSSEIIDVGIMGDGQGAHRIFSWHHDIADGQSHSSIEDRVDAAAASFLRRQRIPGMSLSLSKGGRVVHAKGYGYRDFEQHLPMHPQARCGIASVSKVITALTVMKQHELGNIDVLTERILRDTGTLGAGDPDYGTQIHRNEQSHGPIVGVASYAHAGGDRIVTWYESGRVSVGTYTDPDFYNDVDPALDHYLLPAGKTTSDIVAMAYRPGSGVYTYYGDGTWSRGSIDNLGGIEAPNPDSLYVPMGLDNERIVGVDVDHLDRFVWFSSTGKYAIGDELDPTVHQPWTPYSFVSATEFHKDHIRGIAVSKVTGHTYTYGSSYAGNGYVYKACRET